MQASTRPLAQDAFYPRLKALVIECTGMAFYQDRDQDLERILRMRFEATRIGECASYLDLLGGPAGAGELDELIAELTIGETYFFRYKEQFAALRDTVLPEVIARNREIRRLRIWSAGCATGPEPYTLAIILGQRFAQQIEGWDVTIVGTDINRRFLEKAREGVFEEWALRATPEHVRNSCFEPVGRQWRIAPRYKQWVKFRPHNLVDDPFPTIAGDLHSFDIILCRNVVIYFTTETFVGILDRFHRSLAPEGWLVVGHSELNDQLFRAFRPVDTPGAVLYQKSDQPPARATRGGFLVDFDEPSPLSETPVPTPPPLPEASEAPAWEPLPTLEPPKPEEPPTAADEDIIPQIRRLADQGSWVEAGRLCRRLLEADPLHAAGHLYHAHILEHQGDAAGAEQALRRAIYLDRGSVLPQYHLGLLLRKKGDAAGAARSFRNALKLLAGLDDEAPVADGGGEMAAGELKLLVKLHLDVTDGT